jgi:hypothetical protein
MDHERPKTRYLSYLLRLWETADGEQRFWRASLERPGTGERHSFATLEALFAYLMQETQSENSQRRTPPAEG